ncbi:pleckstrin homology domain-containing family A member 1-like [Saccoglossus kowalevskii]|uniref:Pleckstrin homology domain-containing family A member 1-like n=1 Tax=Saccoglossus kowalevskii TaxID=10224 RepID=A0ABM0H1U9_SACKO|nr:PREDICTED: pleckstrin homology domain-containing family A member 1-like [Saccoglossus kowalevskii]
MPYTDRQNRVCGYLDIEENENSGKFFRRYFMLEPRTSQLFYYMDNPLNLPKGSAPVGALNMTYVSKVNDASRIRPKAEYCFVINGCDRRYYLQANDAQDMMEWIDKLNDSCKIIVPPASTMSQDDSTFRPGRSNSEKTISYKTEVIGGVVVRTPIHTGDSDSDSSDGTGHTNTLPARLSSPSNLHRRRSGCMPIKQGFCVKQGAVMKNWKRRFFILDDHGFSYYKNENDKDAIRTIAIRDMLDCKESTLGDTLLRDNLFEVSTISRTFYIQADSPEEMQSWISSVCGAIMAKRASVATNTWTL